MGTLKDQPPRYPQIEHVKPEDVAYTVKSIAKENNITIDQALKCYELATEESKLLRTIQNGDIKDEQLAGFAELIEEQVSKLISTFTEFFIACQDKDQENKLEILDKQWEKESDFREEEWEREDNEK